MEPNILQLSYLRSLNDLLSSSEAVDSDEIDYPPSKGISPGQQQAISPNTHDKGELTWFAYRWSSGGEVGGVEEILVFPRSIIRRLQNIWGRVNASR